MGKTIKKKTIVRLTTFILITTLLIPLSTHLLNEKINEEKQQQEVSIELDVIIGAPSARLIVTPDTALRDRDIIYVKGRLSLGGDPLPWKEIQVLWNNSYIKSGTTDSNGNFSIPLFPSNIWDEVFGNINVTAWFPGEPESGLYEQWAYKMITVYAVVQMTLTLNPTVLKRNDSFTATTTVAFDNGTVIQGAEVYLSLWNGTEYGPQTTDINGQYSFGVTISSGESDGTKSVTGAVNISTVASDTTYINGTLSAGSTNHFWSNDTKSIQVVTMHTITFSLTANPPRNPGDPQGAYRGSTWVQLEGYFENETGHGKQWETVWAALLISGIYRRISSASYYITTSDGYFNIGFTLPYTFDGYTVSVGDTNVTVLPSTAFPDPYENDKIALRVYSTTYFGGITTDRPSILYHRDETITVTSTLYDDQGAPLLPGLLVSAFLFNQSIGYFSPTYSDWTGSSGGISIDIFPPYGVPPGEASCYLNITFDGSIYYDPSFVDFTIVYFFESPAFIDILLGGTPIGSITTLQKSTNYDVEARLVDEFGRNIVGRTVIVLWNGQQIPTQDTDPEGKIYTSFTTSDYSDNPLSLVFSFDYHIGPPYTESYGFSLDNRAPTIDSFSVDPEDVEIGESCTISISGTDDGPLSNITLVLTDPDGNETRVIQQITTSLNFDIEFIIDTSQSEYDVLGNWTFYLIVSDREGESSFSAQGQFTVIEKEGMDLGDLTLIAAIISANVLAAISGYFIAGKIRAQGGLGPFLQNLKEKLKK